MSVRLVAQEEPLPGYRLVERLGRGGFGEVWKVEAPGGLLKAMKFVFGDLDAADDESRPAEQELKALKRVRDIRHPYILSLERYDILDGQLIIVMELADRNLWDRFRECRAQGLPGIPRDELLRYMEEAAEALDLMNNHYQIQHLDIKPQNLFVVFNHVKVGDFGLAKLLEGVRATVTGGVTPVYAAPETFEGWVSRFSDQYSLGIVFQELLTGTRPFNGANTRALLMQHINGTPEMSALSPADRAIIGRALAKKPDDRWPSCTELVRALKLAGSAPISADVVNPAAPPPPTPPSADSIQATRVAFGGSGRLGPAATPAKTQTPRPANLPPVKPGSGSTGTPMPRLVTVGSGAVVPRLVTPTPANGPGPAMTLQRSPVVQTARMRGLGVAPPEKNGDGALFPALVIGVGHLGRLVVDRLRRVVRDRYGRTEAVPNVRFLCIDTDETPVGDPNAGPAADTIVARLNRPGHYLQADHLPPLDPWMPAGTLYKLPRNPASAGGVRAFGRLALVDNHRAVAQRLRQEVDTFLTDDPLAAADKATGLGLRTNRPRAYVVAGLGGGTGGGMFLDLAYLVRHELRSAGYLRPEVVGVFLVPPTEKAGAQSAALANAHAALAELHHFQAKRTRYQAAFARSEPPVTDGDAPFARCAVVQLHKAADPKRQAAAAGLAARALFNELLTPAGRVVDEVRDVYRNAFPSADPTCQAFGLYRLTWPRPEMLAAATRRFAERLIQRWTAKEAAHLREPIAAWIDGQWADRNLAFEQTSALFRKAARDALREEPEKVFDALLDPLHTRTPSGARLDAVSACGVLDQIIRVVGKPPCEHDPENGSLHDPFAARFKSFARDAEGHLAVMAVSFIEQPQYRLAGAEEAVRQIGERLGQQVDALENVHRDLDKDVRGTYSRLLQAIGSLNGAGWKGSLTGEILDLLRAYPRKRLQLHVLELSLSVYRKLLGNVPEYLREIGLCRTSLNDLQSAVAAAGGPSAEAVGPGRLILPDGCKKIDDAADLFLAGLNPEDILAFDQALQAEATRQFRGLAAVCLKPVEKGPLFRELLLARAREFLDARLDHADPAEVFFRLRDDGPASRALVAEAFDAAIPAVGREAGPHEATILAVPTGPAGDHLRALAAAAVPGAEFTTAPLPDDICVYREYPQLRLADLPQLGKAGREALAQLPPDHPPHARTDVAWQTPAG